jgi:hypothetical protein
MALAGSRLETILLTGYTTWTLMMMTYGYSLGISIFKDLRIIETDRVEILMILLSLIASLATLVLLSFHIKGEASLGVICMRLLFLSKLTGFSLQWLRQLSILTLWCCPWQESHLIIYHAKFRLAQIFKKPTYLVLKIFGLTIPAVYSR